MRPESRLAHTTRILIRGSLKIQSNLYVLSFQHILEEVLFLWDVNGFLLGGVEELIIRQKEKAYILSAVFFGDINKEKYVTFGDVKAITYNEMEILEENGFKVQVVVDI